MAYEFGQRLKHGDINNVPEGWLVFRKYDGHSAIWLPKSQNLSEGISGLWSLGRSNKPEPIAVPRGWLMGLPMDRALHGELWHPNDRPQTITSACKDNPLASEWKDLKLMVFAFPNNTDKFNPSNITSWESVNSDELWNIGVLGMLTLFESNGYEDKGDYLTSGRLALPKSVELSDLTTEWEGLVFQNKRAKYKIGRSSNVLKYKPYYDDEAIVIGYEAGKTGKRIGTTGALIVEQTRSEKLLSVHGCPPDLPLGTTCRFKVSGLDESEWNNTEEVYPLGTEIKFKYLSISNLGTPMHCSIDREHRVEF